MLIIFSPPYFLYPASSRLVLPVIPLYELAICKGRLQYCQGIGANVWKSDDIGDVISLDKLVGKSDGPTSPQKSFERRGQVLLANLLHTRTL